MGKCIIKNAICNIFISVSHAEFTAEIIPCTVSLSSLYNLGFIHSPYC
jgi:hypothetical protein